MNLSVYWLISEDYKRTYVGYTDDIKKRISEHRQGKTKTTMSYGKFRCFELEKVANLNEAVKRERYWKSHAGRKKLLRYFKKIIRKNNMPLSSSG